VAWIARVVSALHLPIAASSLPLLLSVVQLCGSDCSRRLSPLSAQQAASNTSVWGLQLLVYEAFSYKYMRPSATNVCGLRLLTGWY
jgi:hypothetical protein